MDTGQIIGSVGVLIAALVASFFTRRSAKDTTAIGGFTELTKALQEERKELSSRVDALEAKETTRQRQEMQRTRLLRQHSKWDQWVVDVLRPLTDEPIPDPPPLDIEV